MIHLKQSPLSVAVLVAASTAWIGIRSSAHFWRAMTSTSRPPQSGFTSPSLNLSFAGLSSVISPSTVKNAPSLGVRARVRRLPSMKSWLKRNPSGICAVQSPPSVFVHPVMRRPPLTMTFSPGAAVQVTPESSALKTSVSGRKYVPPCRITVAALPRTSSRTWASVLPPGEAWTSS